MPARARVVGGSFQRLALTAAVVAVAALSARAVANAQASASTPNAAASVVTLGHDASATATLDGGATAEARPAVASASVPMQSLLGRTMREISQDAGPALDGGGAWRPYRGDVFVQFRGDRVVRATARVPAWSSCTEVARRFGFDAAMPPIRRARRCEWPARSLRHLLASGLAAEFDAARGAFEVWLVE